MALWRRPERFDPDRGFLRTWLATVARGRAIDLVRAQEADRRRLDQDRRRRLDHVPDSCDALEAQQSADELWMAVKSLDENRRSAIVLAYFNGRTYRQVADDLGVPEGRSSRGSGRGFANWPPLFGRRGSRRHVERGSAQAVPPMTGHR